MKAKQLGAHLPDTLSLVQGWLLSFNQRFPNASRSIRNWRGLVIRAGRFSDALRFAPFAQPGSRKNPATEVVA